MKIAETPHATARALVMWPRSWLQVFHHNWKQRHDHKAVDTDQAEPERQ